MSPSPEQLDFTNGLFSCQSESNDPGLIDEEDIWTALRDHTQVRRIWVVDLGKSRPVADPLYSFGPRRGTGKAEFELSHFACHVQFGTRNASCLAIVELKV